MSTNSDIQTIQPDFQYGFWDNAKDSAKSYIKTGVTAGSVFTLSNFAALRAMRKYENRFLDSSDVLHRATEKAVELANLTSKNVNIKYVTTTPPKNILQKFAAYLNPDIGVNSGYNAITVIENKAKSQFRKGDILLPEMSLPLAGFHEIGHQVNLHSSKIASFLGKSCFKNGKIAGLIMLYGVLTNKSVPEKGKELTFLQKANNFIRDNAVTLSFLSMIPELIDEGMASYNGQKLANKLLPKTLAGAVKKSNMISFSTYAIGAVGIGIMAGLMVHFKDEYAKSRQNSVHKDKKQTAYT